MKIVILVVGKTEKAFRPICKNIFKRVCMTQCQNWIFTCITGAFLRMALSNYFVLSVSFSEYPINIIKNDFHGEWNYSILPTKRIIR